MAYRVYLEDNYVIPHPQTWIPAGEFDSAAEALAAAKGRVEASLREHWGHGMSAGQLYQEYITYGDDVFVVATEPPQVDFHAWNYAKARCAQICAEMEQARASDNP